jgi:uncharacterized membrane protein
MNQQRIIGIVLTVIGIILFIIGMNSSESFSDQFSEFFRGRFTESTTWYILGGIALTLLGLGMLVVPWRGKST